jgi:iron(III) transport system permease protein
VQIDKSLEEAAWVSGATRASRRCPQGAAADWHVPSVQSAFFLLVHGVLPRDLRPPMLLFTASSNGALGFDLRHSFEQANWGLASALSPWSGRLHHLHRHVRS